MRICTTREILLPAISTIGNIVERRQTLPILSNMLFQVTGGILNLTATDLEIEVRTFGSVDGEGEGEFTLPARKFIDICRALPEHSVLDISVDGARAVIKSGKSKFSLGILPASDYPNIEFIAPDFSLEIEEATLKHLIENTAFSMAQQDVRYYLNGLLIEFDRGLIKAVATDGHRLALSEKSIEDADLSKKQYLIPRKAVVELARMLDYTDKLVRIEFSQNLARFNVNETTFITKLIDGRFPDYNKVVPKICDKKAIIERHYLKDALGRASILSSEKYKGIRLSFERNVLLIQAHNPEQEEAEEQIDVEYSEEPLTIGFNAGYLLDILNSISTDTVIIELANSNSSALVKNPQDEGSLYVLMPMRM